MYECSRKVAPLWIGDMEHLLLPPLDHRGRLEDVNNDGALHQRLDC